MLKHFYHRFSLILISYECPITIHLDLDLVILVKIRFIARSYSSAYFVHINTNSSHINMVRTVNFIQSSHARQLFYLIHL